MADPNPAKQPVTDSGIAEPKPEPPAVAAAEIPEDPTTASDMHKIAVALEALSKVPDLMPRLEKIVLAQEIAAEKRKAHPDEWHFYRAAHVRQVISKNLIVSYVTMAQDPWLKMPYKDGGGGLNSRMQFHRMLDQNLLAGVPRGVWAYDAKGEVKPGSRFRLLKIPDDSPGKAYLTIECFLHCAIVRICRRKRLDERPWLKFYEAGESCEWCHPPKF